MGDERVYTISICALCRAQTEEHDGEDPWCEECGEFVRVERLRVVAEREETVR